MKAGISATEAAKRLGVSSQTIRNWIGTGDLRATKQRDRWVIDPDSLAVLGKRRGVLRASTAPPELAIQVGELIRMVSAISDRQDELMRSMDSLRQERDRFRAESATARESALAANAVAAKTQEAVGQLLEALQLQTNSVSQLLLPALPVNPDA
jgi:excisionase family DNA binding protein